MRVKLVIVRIDPMEIQFAVLQMTLVTRHLMVRSY